MAALHETLPQQAQEIHGAIIPLAETYSRGNPFLGVVLAGVFTQGSLQQLRSNRFTILYFPYESVVRAFASVGIDASFDEETPDRELQRKVDAYDALSDARKLRIARELQKIHQAEVDAFVACLDESLTRKVVKVRIAALHGPTCEVLTVEDAVMFIENYGEKQSVAGFVRYELDVAYSNGDHIACEFHDKNASIAFLMGL